jgi:anti-sigma B factor antagonist
MTVTTQGTASARFSGVEPVLVNIREAWRGRRRLPAAPKRLITGLPRVGLAAAAWTLWERGIVPDRPRRSTAWAACRLGPEARHHLPALSGWSPVRGAMPVPQTLNVSRHDKTDRTLISLTGEIDVDSTPLLRETLGCCLLDGVRSIDIDLTGVTFCDCNGVNALLSAAQRAAAAGGAVRVHHPPAMLVRLFALTGADVLVAAVPAAPVRSGLAPAVPAVPGGAP